MNSSEMISTLQWTRLLTGCRRWGWRWGRGSTVTGPTATSPGLTWDQAFSVRVTSREVVTPVRETAGAAFSPPNLGAVRSSWASSPLALAVPGEIYQVRLIFEDGLDIKYHIPNTKLLNKFTHSICISLA